MYAPFRQPDQPSNHHHHKWMSAKRNQTKNIFVLAEPTHTHTKQILALNIEEDTTWCSGVGADRRRRIWDRLILALSLACSA